MAESIAIWIGSGEATPRHRYVAYILFDVVLNRTVVWPTSREEWRQWEGPKVQYGGTHDPSSGGSWVPATGWLEGNAPTHLSEHVWSDAEGPGVPGVGRLPFGVAHAEGDRVDADWWSWVFWMVTRAEERTLRPDQLDAMGRFKATQSVAFKEGWLGKPEVECRVRAWAESQGILPESRSYSVFPTIDVDSAFAYQHRSFFRNLGATAKDLMRLDAKRLSERWKVLVQGAHDPFDSYDWLERIHARYGLRARYFMLLADRGPFDRPVHWNQPGMAQLVKHLMQSADVGIHPGVGSHEGADSGPLEAEIDRLAQLTDGPVVHARQHYLLQSIPATWRRLEAAGIRHDHTLGYADCIGFRAGLSRPFRAFDLEANRPMELTLHPIAAMDATLNRYMGLNPDEALDALETLAGEVKAVEGDFTLLWHNETVAERNEWKGWRRVYEQVFERIC
jgi:hypothetical protein